MTGWRLKVFLLALVVAGAARLAAQPTPAFSQNIGGQLPLAVRLVDETGRTAPLGSWLGHRPLLLLFGYYNCPQLCSVLERSAVDTLRDLKPTVGRDFDVVYLSIDPTDLPAEARRRRDEAVQNYGRPGSAAGWHYLTGSAAAVQAVANAAGFGYRYDPRTHWYMHPSGFVVVTPSGKISRYFLGIDFPADAAAAAFRRAAAGQTGEPVFNLLLECFRGDGFAGRYGPLIWRVLEGAVALTVVVVFGGIGWLLWRERRRGALAR
jgi:protein SCO1/2